MKHFRLIFSSAMGASVAIVFAVAVTIWGELSVPFKNWLTQFSGHHWVTKSIFVMVIYGIAMAYVHNVVKNPGPTKVALALNRLTLVSLLGAAVLVLFFLWHFYG